MRLSIHSRSKAPTYLEMRSWFAGEVEEPKVSIQLGSEPFLAVRGSSFKEGGVQRWIYSSTGPMGTMTVKGDPVTGHDGGLFFDNRDGGIAARRLEPFEVWTAAGHDAKRWRASLQSGCQVPQLM